MAGPQVTVVVRIKAKAGMEARVKQELFDLLAPTRVEHGCINFDMHQAPGDPSLFLFHENWQQEADLKKHFDSPHIKRWLREAEKLLVEPMELTRWQKVD